jgi:pimeloyl-ACP methyl ester carboxylesterase
MGGHVAIVTSLRFPTLVSKLVLIAPSGFEKFNPFEISMLKNTMTIGNMFFNDETHLVTLLKQSFYKMPESGSKMISDLVTLLKGENMRQWRNMVEQCIIGMLNEQVFDLLKFLECPVLAIFGENDTLIPNIYFHPVTTKRIAEIACAEIPNARLSIIPFSGHAVFMEKPEKVNQMIIDFIGK